MRLCSSVAATDFCVSCGAGNVGASLPGFLIPPIGMMLRQATGSWKPLFALSAALMLGTGIAFGRCSQVEPAEEELVRWDREKQRRRAKGE